jgi:hypothetical protein
MPDADRVEADQDEDEEERDGLVPYAPDFTPATLGKRLGADRVLGWLLEHARGSSRATLALAIAEQCLDHVPTPKDRRDMASHVIQGLQNYGLIAIDDEEKVALTSAGASLIEVEGQERDERFARHILTTCNGYRLVEAIQRAELAEQRVGLEILAETLDRNSTSKNISTMRAWLERAGVFAKGKNYKLVEARVDELLGHGTTRLFGLDDRQVEFVLAARILTAQQPTPMLEAAEIKMLAESRTPEVKLPSKALGNFARTLVVRGLFTEHAKAHTKGGTRVTLQLSPQGHELTDGQVRELVKQASSSIPLSELLPIARTLEELERGTAERKGKCGEMLAVHACLMLGLRVVGWRTCDTVEVDLTAERTAALTFQRWRVQVKNTGDDLDADRVDRELGAAAGTGVTHLLFVVPRAGLSATAKAEIDAKNKLTHLHVFHLTRDAFAAPVQVAALIRELRGQEARLTRIKRFEAERRERLA